MTIIPYKPCVKILMYQGTHYQLFNQTISDRAEENIALTNKFIEIHEASHQRYGAPKFHILLERISYTVCIKRVQHLMKEAGIQSIVVKKFRHTPSKKVVERDNLLDRDFSTETFNEKWVTDITEFSIPAREVYLTPMDD